MMRQNSNLWALILAGAVLTACSGASDEAADGTNVSLSPETDISDAPPPPAELPSAETETSPAQPLTLASEAPLAWRVETLTCEGEAIVDGTLMLFDPDFGEVLFEETRLGVEAFCAIADDEADGLGLWENNVSWTASAVSETDGIISLVSRAYEYAGGAHGNFGTGTLIWDREADAEVPVEDLFTSRAAMADALVPSIRAVIQVQKSERYGYDLPADEIAELLNDEMTWLTRVSFLPSSEAQKFGGLAVHFDPYDIGVYAEGGYVADVAQADFHSALTPEWQARFAGVPPS